MSEDSGVNYAALHSQQMHNQSISSHGGGSSGGGIATAQDISLGEHPVKMPGALPTLGGGAAIQIPGGVEGQGALADTMIELGNQDPFGLPKEAMIGLHQVNNVGETSLDKATSPGSNLNAINDHGLGAVDAISSNGAGRGH